MEVSYERLFELINSRNLKKTEFAKMVGIGQNTLAKLSKNEHVSMDILIKICQGMDCKIEDIMEFIKC